MRERERERALREWRGSGGLSSFLGDIISPQIVLSLTLVPTYLYVLHFYLKSNSIRLIQSITCCMIYVTNHDTL